MRETTCPTCGGKVLAPDPEPNTKEQNIAFRKAWDARVDEGDHEFQLPSGWLGE